MKLKSMKLKAVIVVLAVLLSGCDLVEELCAVEAEIEGPRVWAFMQFNVPEEGGEIGSYYYYGNISKELYEKINSNTIKRGFMLLEKVRYWGDDDLVHEYKDKEYSGNLVFRVEDLVRIKGINSDPLLGFDEPKQATAPVKADIPTVGAKAATARVVPRSAN